MSDDPDSESGDGWGEAGWGEGEWPTQPESDETDAEDGGFVYSDPDEGATLGEETGGRWGLPDTLDREPGTVEPPTTAPDIEGFEYGFRGARLGYGAGSKWSPDRDRQPDWRIDGRRIAVTDISVTYDTISIDAHIAGRYIPTWRDRYAQAGDVEKVITAGGGFRQFARSRSAIEVTVRPQSSLTPVPFPEDRYLVLGYDDDPIGSGLWYSISMEFARLAPLGPQQAGPVSFVFPDLDAEPEPPEPDPEFYGWGEGGWGEGAWPTQPDLDGVWGAGQWGEGEWGYSSGGGVDGSESSSEEQTERERELEDGSEDNVDGETSPRDAPTPEYLNADEDRTSPNDSGEEQPFAGADSSVGSGGQTDTTHSPQPTTRPSRTSTTASLTGARPMGGERVRTRSPSQGDRDRTPSHNPRPLRLDEAAAKRRSQDPAGADEDVAMSASETDNDTVVQSTLGNQSIVIDIVDEDEIGRAPDEWMLQLATGDLFIHQHDLFPDVGSGEQIKTHDLTLVLTDDELEPILTSPSHLDGVHERSVPDGDNLAHDGAGGRNAVGLIPPADSLVEMGVYLITDWEISPFGVAHWEVDMTIRPLEIYETAQVEGEGFGLSEFGVAPFGQ